MVGTQGKFHSGKCLFISKLMIPRPRTCTGSSDNHCTGIKSSSVNETIHHQFTQAAASAHKRKQSIIIGICTTLALLVLVGLGVTTFLWIRRRQRRKQQEVALSPHPFVELEKTPGQVPFVNSNPNPSRITGLSISALAATSAVHSASIHSQGLTRPILSPSNNHPITHSTVTNTNANAQPNTSGSTAIPTTSMRGNRTAEEAGHTNETIVSPVDSAEVEGGVAFQHRDGGRIVYELPPPYFDQVGSGHSSPS
jgi:hypothetical protein